MLGPARLNAVTYFQLRGWRSDEMIYAFVVGVMVTLTPSLIAVAWLVWRADGPTARQHRTTGRRNPSYDKEIISN